MGALERITLDADAQGGARLRLIASAPAMYRMLRRGDRVQLELLNIAARPGEVGFDRARFPQIERMRVEPLSVGQPNSKFILTLDKDAKWEAVVQPDAADSRALTLLLAPASQVAYKPGGPLVKAPFAARVVVDAGHGGKDQAPPEGFLERI